MKNSCKSFFILLVLLLLFNKSFSQKQNDFDSLRKYSYSLIGFSNEGLQMHPHGGTCFFVRKKSKIFLVTAKHVVNGCEGTYKNSYYPKMLTLAILDSNETPKAFIQVDISKIIDTTSCPDSTADIIAFETIDSNTSKLYSVENFILPPFENTDNIDMYGFPSETLIDSERHFRVPKASHIHIRKKNTVFTTFTYPNTKKLDSTCLGIVSPDLKADTMYLHGYSGAPVFIKKYNSNKIRICGAFTTFGFAKYNKDYKYIGAAKIEYGIEQIDKLLR